MFPDKIWFYISERVDNDNILPSQDEIYTKFKDYFDILGYKIDVATQQMEAYLSCSQIDGVVIEWEGSLDGASNRGNAQELEISQEAI